MLFLLLSIAFAAPDCTGLEGGTTFYSNCGVCGGENTHLLPHPATLTSSASFPGITSRATLASFASWPSSAITVEFWVYVDPPDGDGLPRAVPFSYAHSSEVNELCLYDIHENGGVGCRIILHDVNYDCHSFTVNSAWHHIAITWRGDTGALRLYKDGSQVCSWTGLVGSMATGGTLVLAEEQDEVGGGYHVDQVLVGRLAELRIWNVARLQTELAASMYSTCRMNDAGWLGMTGDDYGNLVAYWPFDTDWTDIVGSATFSAANSAAITTMAGGPTLNGCPTPYHDLCNVCGGDNDTCRDCVGIPNGGHDYDDCGVCDGSNACIPDPDPDETVDEPPVGPVVGAVVGGAALLVLVGGLVLIIRKRKSGESTVQEGVFGVVLNPKLNEPPRVVLRCTDYLEGRALKETGLFRLPGDHAEIHRIKAMFDKGDDVDLGYVTDNIHTVASLLKAFFREMPDPLLTFELYDMFLAAAAIPDEAARLDRINKVLGMLPRANYITLEHLVRFLLKVEAESEVNKMHSHNLALVFAPNILRHIDDNQDVIQDLSFIQDGAYANNLLVAMMHNVEQCFPPGRAAALAKKVCLARFGFNVSQKHRPLPTPKKAQQVAVQMEESASLTSSQQPPARALPTPPPKRTESQI